MSWLSQLLGIDRLEASMSDLSNAVASLKQALATEASQISAKIDGLEQQLAAALDLNANPDVQAAVADLRAATENIQGIVADVPDEPAVDPNAPVEPPVEQDVPDEPPPVPVPDDEPELVDEPQDEPAPSDPPGPVTDEG